MPDNLLLALSASMMHNA